MPIISAVESTEKSVSKHGVPKGSNSPDSASLGAMKPSPVQVSGSSTIDCTVAIITGMVYVIEVKNLRMFWTFPKAQR